MSVTKQLITVTAIAAAALLSAGVALAGEVGTNPGQPAAPLSRATVIADLLAARSSGQWAGAGQADLPAALPVVSSRSRADVQAEFALAQQRHELQAAGEIGTVDHQAPGIGRSRADVKAEVLAAREDGTLPAAGEGLAINHPIARARSKDLQVSLQR